MKLNKIKKFLIIGIAFVLLSAVFVFGGDIIAKQGDFNVTGNLIVDTNTLFVDSVNDRVGIGIVTPAHSLEVVGNIAATSTGTNSLNVISTNPDAYPQFGMSHPHQSWGFGIKGGNDDFYIVDKTTPGGYYYPVYIYDGAPTGAITLDTTENRMSQKLKVTGDTNITENLSVGDYIRGGHVRNVYKAEVEWDSLSPIEVVECNDGDVVTDVWVEITTAFDGSTSLTIGDCANSGGYGINSKIIPQDIGWKLQNHDDRGVYLYDSTNKHDIDKIYTSACEINISKANVTAASQGHMDVYVEMLSLK